MLKTTVRTAPADWEGTKYPPPGGAAYVIGVLFLVTVMSQLDRQLPALLVRPLRSEFGLSDTAFSLLQGYAFAVAFAVAGVAFGQLVDRRNRRNLLCAGLLFWCAATALFAFGQSYETLLLARVGVGVGEAVLAPAAYSLIADLVPPGQRGRALAAYGVSSAIGTGASLLLGGWLLAIIPPHGLHIIGLGDLAAWRVAFLVAAAAGLPLALFLISTVDEPARKDTTAPGTMVPDPSSLADFVGYLRSHPGVLARLLTYPTILAMLGYGALGWAPALFERSHGYPPAKSGLALGGLVALAGTLGILTGGYLSDRWLARAIPAARLRVALVGLAVATLPAVSWSVVHQRNVSFALLFVTVLGIGLAQSAVPTAIQAVFPNRLRGKAFALYLLLVGLFGIGLGPTAVALVTDHVFHDEGALGLAIAMTAAPAALLGLWIIVTGLRPYAALHAGFNSGQRSCE